MRYRLPWASLIKMNWIVSLISSVLIFAFLITTRIKPKESVFRFLEAFLFLWLISFVDLLLLRLCSKDNEVRDRVAMIKFLACSYISALFLGGLASALHVLISDSFGLSFAIRNKTIIPSVLAILSLNTLILIMQSMVILQHKKVQQDIENLQLKARASEMNNLLLRQQIHPHFLFNSLNTIKALYKLDLKQGEDYLIHLANFLRIAISNQKATIVPVRSELEFCLDYLKMQKIRFGTALDYRINIDGRCMDTRHLPYFSLQPLAENVIKHNDLTEERPILITIEETGGYLRVSNNLQASRYKEPSTGYGLSNLSERYQLLGYEGVRIEEDNDHFAVSIKILDS